MMLQHPAAADEIRRIVHEILARKEFAAEEDSWFVRLLKALDEQLHLGFGAAGMARAVFWVMAIALGAVVAWIALREVLLRVQAAGLARSAGRSGAAADLSRRVEELLEAARSARARGELVLALRLSFFALVVGLGRRGDLEYRDAWTNRELLERGAPRAEVAALLAPLVEVLDRKGFGLEPAREADVDDLEALCRRVLR
jgi:cytosine/adenosine deaminase-related metal-dependent hydrolase